MFFEAGQESIAVQGAGNRLALRPGMVYLGGTDPEAAPLGPVMELGVAGQKALTPDTAAQSVA